MVAKRKLNSHNLCIDPKKNLTTPKKPQTKADIAKELKSMQVLNKALEEENRNNVNKIKILEDRILSLENKNTSSAKQSLEDKLNKFCQTESEELIFCYENEFPAKDYYDFGEHMLKYHFNGTCRVCDETFTTKEKLSDHISDDHPHEENRPVLSSDHFKCNHCEQSFASKDNLMVHKKQQHIEMIDTCWGYISGNCIFGDQNCWFRHSPSISSDIQCKLCNESFRTKHEYKKHKKQKHSTEVPNK